jgi:putative ABC transport system permease protein
VTEAALTPSASLGVTRRAGGVGLIASIAWRNLGRNRRRTWLTAGGIGFAIALLGFFRALQLGGYATMIDNATALLSGHLQIQRVGYRDDPRIEMTLPQARERAEAIRAIAGVRAATDRVESFVLVSVGEKSFAGQLLGVDPRHEAEVSRLPKMLATGRFLQAADTNSNGDVEGVAGEVLAKNLGIGVGDELVLLGTDIHGGVAALAVKLVGTLRSGQAELDRALLEVPIGPVRDAFGLDADAANAIVVRLDSAGLTDALAARLRHGLPADETVLTWPTLMPDLKQAIDLDWTSGQMMYSLLVIIVVFSIVNTFVMTVFERTREFGLLLAIGTRPATIVAMLHLEAFWISLLGVVAGLAVAVPLILWSQLVGIPISGSASEMMAAYYMPDRMYGALSTRALLPPILLMIVAAQLAALLPALRVWRIRPVEALRDA